LSPVPLLECQQIAFARDDYPLFSGVDLQLFPSQAVQVKGVNGAGKTTLLRILATSLIASEGDILWQGTSIRKQMPHYRRSILHIGHHAGVKGTLSPEENLHWYFQIYPSQDYDSREVLSWVGLQGYEDVPCHTLSAGQLRRVALARLYLTTAQLWILDEPFTSIDVDGVAHLEALMERHLDQGGSILLTSHQQPRLANLGTLELEAYVPS
jgi:heme exporter protein A